MKARKLVILLLPLLIAGCSQNNESKQYQAVIDDEQQTIMKDYYRRHTANLSNLNVYTYQTKLSYDPTYDVFGSLAPQSSLNGKYFEQTITSETDVYSGYLICNSSLTTYTGNKSNIGSVDTMNYNVSFWFTDFEEKQKDEVELIHRTESKDNDLEPIIIDERTSVGVKNDETSRYFADRINTDYSDYIMQQLIQPITSTTKQVSAYFKSQTEIVETYRESIELEPIQNPIHPGDEYKMAVIKQTIGETTFKFLDNIGWVGTDFKEVVTCSLVSDYELKLLDEPRIVKKEETNISFTYATSMQPYVGETFVFQKEDEKNNEYMPSMFTYANDEYIPMNVSVKNVTTEYRKIHTDFSGYAYCFDPVALEEGALYSFACHVDLDDTPNYEAIGFRQLTSNASGTIVSGGISGHNFIKTITTTTTYEFIVLVSANGTKSLIAHLSK